MITRAKFGMSGAALAAAGALFLGSTGAYAADVEETESVLVHFGDLDLNTSNGVHHMYMRLQNAAKSVCGDEFEAIDLSERGNILDCQRDAIQHAVEYVNRPRLTALYDHHHPHEPAVVSASLEGASRG